MYDHLSEIATRTDHANALHDARHWLGADLQNRPPRGLRRFLAFARRHTAATLRRGDPDEPRTRTGDVRPQAATQQRSGNAARLVTVSHPDGRSSTGAMEADVNFTLDEGPLLGRSEPDDHLLEAVGIVGTELEPGEEIELSTEVAAVV